jgi:hypothetical protein
MMADASNPFEALALRQISSPRKAQLRAAEKRAQSRVEKAQLDKETQFVLWREWRRERSDALLAGPYADAARDLIALLNRLRPNAADMLLERVCGGPWRDADPDTRFLILALIDAAIVEMRERNGLPPFDDPVLPDDPLNVFLTLRELLT